MTSRPPTSSRPESDRDYFDRLVAERGDFNPFSDAGWERLAARFREIAREPVERLLDVGCGTGQSRRVYAGRARRYAGVDLSFAALRAGRRANAHLAFVQADALVLPLPDASCDAVAFSSVLHHLPDRSRALAEAYRVLRPGGLVFAFDPNVLHPGMALFRHPASPLYRSEGVSPQERPLAPGRLRREFVAAGFGDAAQRCQSAISYRYVAPAGLARALPLYNAVDRLWEASGLGRRFGTFVLTWAHRPDGRRGG